LYPEFPHHIAAYIIFALEMKKTALFCIAVIASSLAACNSGNNRKTDNKPKQFPKPGTVVAKAEMPVTDDRLNKFTFSVKVIADSNITSGEYDVDADYGPNFAEGHFTMPKGGETLVPVLRQGNTPYTYIVGFHLPGDTTFYDYFEISSGRNTTKMQYVKAYTF
jgi:hypothetical protein